MGRVPGNIQDGDIIIHGSVMMENDRPQMSDPIKTSSSGPKQCVLTRTQQ